MTSRQPPVVGKQEMRDRLLVRRRTRSPESRAEAGTALADMLLAAPEVQAAGTVAAYVSVGTEPPTDVLLQRLRRHGVGVLLPVLLPDLDLAWGEYAGPDSLEHGPRGMRQPGGPRLRPGAVASVDAVLCPGLAVDMTGLRLGRGGGSYDRVLARLPAGVWSCVLLYADEVVDTSLPADPHDQRVRAAATPDGIIRFAR
ncbi:MAG: 5-formyltetrahydrofolate cyclo-ligase [Actinomycetota bacterium]|nr:5-formyltetrahydrofolate cyclo-ligase [Actinomycetota bacterium]